MKELINLTNESSFDGYYFLRTIGNKNYIYNPTKNIIGFVDYLSSVEAFEESLFCPWKSLKRTIESIEHNWGYEIITHLFEYDFNLETLEVFLTEIGDSREFIPFKEDASSPMKMDLQFFGRNKEEENKMTSYDRIPSEIELIQAMIKEVEGGNKMSNKQRPQVELYVDGSWSSNSPDVAGWGFAAVHPTRLDEKTGDKKVLAVRYGTAPADSQQIGGELKATMAAIKWAKEKGAKRVVIYYDYAGIEKWATGEWKAKKQLPEAYARWMQKQMKEVDVHFIKVKAHTGNKYNDLADNLAKEGIKASVRG